MINRTQGIPGGISVLSFFTGGGFLDLGFIKAGYNIIWTNESCDMYADMYEHAVSIYKRRTKLNHMPAKISDRRQVEDISARAITRKAFPRGRPVIFGIIGGPPCPDFSSCGRNDGYQGENGHLSRVFIDRICDIKPDFFIFENVPGLSRTKKHARFLESIKRKLEHAGYLLDSRIVNALDVGLAQDRERLFLVGISRKIANSLSGKWRLDEFGSWFPWPDVRKYSGAKAKFNWPSVVQRGKRPIKPRGVPIELTVYPLLRNEKKLARMPNGMDNFQPYSDKFNQVREGDTKRKSFKRLHRYRYSPTACYGNNEVHLHPWRNRRLTVREVMRIQGVPDCYALPKEIPLSAKFKLVANGVPVPLAYQVAMSMKKVLFRYLSQDK